MTASKVIDRLYIGDWQEARDASVPNLVKVTVAKGSPFTGDFFFPLVDTDDAHNGQELWKAVEKVDQLMSQNRIVLVHCVSGVSRSCVVIMGYLATRRGMSLDEALDIVRKARPAVLPEPDLLELLKAPEARRE